MGGGPSPKVPQRIARLNYGETFPWLKDEDGNLEIVD